MAALKFRSPAIPGTLKRVNEDGVPSNPSSRPRRRPSQALSFFKRQGFGQAVRHVYLSRNLDDHPRAIERRFDGETEDEG
jgi:hypothetical protein